MNSAFRFLIVIVSALLWLAGPAAASEPVGTELTHSCAYDDTPCHASAARFTAYDLGAPLVAPSPRQCQTAYPTAPQFVSDVCEVRLSCVGAATTAGDDGGIRRAPSSLRANNVAANTASKFGSLTHSSSGIASYSTQRALTAGKGGSVQAHHLIEKRFAAVIGQNTADMSAIVVTRGEHQVFTNAWRQAIPYGGRNVTPSMVNNAGRNIYRDYPEILQALGLG